VAPVDDAVELIRSLIIILVLLYVLFFVVNTLFINLPFI